MKEKEFLNDTGETDTAVLKDKPRKVFSLIDFFVAVLFIALAIGSYVYFNQISRNGDLAIVAKNNNEIYRIDLKNIDEPYDLIIDKEHNVVLYIEPDGVSIKSSDCKDQTCVKMGKISKDGETLVCLPNGYTVFIDSEKSSDIDAVLR